MFSDLTHYAYQLAIFTENSTIPPDEFSVFCRKNLKIGNATPSFVPEFPGMPPEIPRVQIQSDAGYSITLSGVRIDLVLDLAFGIGDDEKKSYIDNAKSLASIFDEHGIKISRVGFVKRFLKVIDEPGQRISQLFGGHGGEALVDFSVNSIIRADFHGRRCNDIYNYSAGVIRGVDQGLVAYRDLNIVPGEKALSSAEAIEFIGEADARLTGESLGKFVGDMG